jgi:hypothetical protein
MVTSANRVFEGDRFVKLMPPGKPVNPRQWAFFIIALQTIGRT